MKYIILSANDMGMSKGVNEGIIDAYKNGVLSQAAVLATSDFLEDALAKSKANPGLAITAHLDLSNGKPLLESSWCLTDDDGYFVTSSGINHAKFFTSQQHESVNLELRAQIDKLIKMGFKITAISTHKEFSKNPNLYKTLISICNDYNLPIRDVDSMYKNFGESLNRGTILSSTKLYGEDVNMDFFKQLTTQLFNKERIINITTHPGIADKELIKQSIYNKQREVDLAFLKSKALKKYLKDNDIEVTNYSKLK